MDSDPAWLELTQPAGNASRISDIQVYTVLDLNGQEHYMPGQAVATDERHKLDGSSAQCRGLIGTIKVWNATPLQCNLAPYMCRTLQNTYLVKLCVDSP